MNGAAVHVLRQRAALFGFNAPPWDALPVTLRVGELNPAYEIATTADFDAMQLRMGGRTRLEPPEAVIGDAGGNEVITVGAGHTEQIARLLKGAYSERQGSWADTAFGTGSTSVDLDQVYPRIVKSSLVAFERTGVTVVRRIAAVTETPRADFGVAARVTRLTFAAGDLAGFSPRTTNVLGQSEPLAVAGAPLAELVGGVDVLDLAREVPGHRSRPDRRDHRRGR